jgi:outer membrane protein
MGLRPIAVCSALFALSQIASGQVKVAVVNLQEAVFKSAEIQKADGEMQAKYKPRQEEINTVTTEGNDLMTKYQGGQGKMTEIALEDLQAQIQKKQRELQRLQEDLNADVERERNEVLTKASQKMSDVVKKLAEEKGVDLVVDSMPGATVLYFKPALDLTTEAIAAYDKAYPVEAAPANTGATPAKPAAVAPPKPAAAPPKPAATPAGR